MHLIITRYRTKTWGSKIESDPPTIQYADVMGSDDGVKLWTDLIVLAGNDSSYRVADNA